MGDDLRLKTPDGDGLDAVKHPAPRRPQLHFLQEIEEVNALAVISFLCLHTTPQ